MSKVSRNFLERIEICAGQSDQNHKLIRRTVMQRQSLDKIIQQAILWTIILYIKHDDRDTHD